MWAYLGRRILILIPTLILVSIIVFSVIQFIPGDPVQAMFGMDPMPEQIEQVRRLYHLDEPVPVQYLLWAGNMLRGDMGESISRRRPVAGMIAERLPRSMLLAGASILVALVMALPIGVISAAKQNTWWDFTLSAGALVSLSMPGFWKGILGLLIFSVMLGWFPTSGWAPLREGIGTVLYHLVLPSLALGTGLAAVGVRILRSSLLEVLRQEYITVARSKGLTERVVLYRHALRNALIPTITIVGMQIGYLLGGSIIIEQVFSYPGMGLQLIQALTARDYPLIQGQILIFATFFVLVNLATDLLYGVINPKIRYN